MLNLGIVPARLDFTYGFRSYWDDESPIDSYPRFFLDNHSASATLQQRVSQKTKFRCPDHHGIYELLPYGSLNLIMQRYFQPSARVQSTAEKLLEKYAIDINQLVSICYRGTDKGTEVRLADPEEYIAAAKSIVKPGMKVLIQTDQLQVREQMLKSIPGSFYFEEMPVTSGTKVIHQLATEDLGQSRMQFSDHLLAVSWILSQSQTLVTHSGNMALWICLFRGHNRGIIQFDKNGVRVGPRQRLSGRVKSLLREAKRILKGELTSYT